MKLRMPQAIGSFALRVSPAIRRDVRQPPRLPVQAVAALLLVVVAGGSAAKLVAHQADELPENAAFRVDNTVVTKDALQQQIKVMGVLYGLRKPTDAKRLDQFNRSVAKAVAVSRIVDSAARERGITIADKAASDQLDKLIKQSKLSNRTTFLRELGTRGISERQVLDEVKRQEANARLFGQLTKSTKPTTDQEAREYYDKNKSQMASPEQRELSNIVVHTQQQAQQLLQLVKPGADFGSLARQYSIDGSTKEAGGSMGPVTADQLEPNYSKAAFQAAPGSVFGPVQTPQGWNVGKVDKIQQATPLSFAQLKNTIKAKLDNDAKLKTWSTFLTEQIQDTDVTYAPEYQPSDPDAPAKPGA